MHFQLLFPACIPQKELIRSDFHDYDWIYRTISYFLHMLLRTYASHQSGAARSVNTGLKCRMESFFNKSQPRGF